MECEYLLYGVPTRFYHDSVIPKSWDEVAEATARWQWSIRYDPVKLGWATGYQPDA